MKVRFKHLDELKLECDEVSLKYITFPYTHYSIIKSMYGFFDGKTVVDVEQDKNTKFFLYRSYCIHERWVDIVKPSDDICELFDDLIRDLQ